MTSVSKVMLIGNLAADPESSYLPSGDALCNLRLATTEKWKDKASGEVGHVKWGATIILSGRTTIMMAGGEESKAA